MGLYKQTLAQRPSVDNVDSSRYETDETYPLSP